MQRDSVRFPHVPPGSVCSPLCAQRCHCSEASLRFRGQSCRQALLSLSEAAFLLEEGNSLVMSQTQVSFTAPSCLLDLMSTQGAEALPQVQGCGDGDRQWNGCNFPPFWPVLRASAGRRPDQGGLHRKLSRTGGRPPGPTGKSSFSWTVPRLGGRATR